MNDIKEYRLYRETAGKKESLLVLSTLIKRNTSIIPLKEQVVLLQGHCRESEK